MINQLDEDNKSIIPSGDAYLDGAIYNLYNDKEELIQELVIENNKASINNLNYLLDIK